MRMKSVATGRKDIAEDTDAKRAYHLVHLACARLFESRDDRLANRFFALDDLVC